MDRKEKVRRCALYQIKKWGIDHASEMMDYFTEYGVYDDDFCDEVKLHIAQIKKRKSPTTKYKRFHPNQMKVIH